MSDVNKIPEGSCPHCSPTPADEPGCAPAEGSTGCGCRHKQRTEEEYKHLITRLNRIEGQIRGIRSMVCLLYTSPSPRDRQKSRMPSSA